MLRSLDIVLICVMTGAATVTYTIKHRAENKLEEVRKLDAEIKLEEDTIDLLRADWALLTQPNRLERLVNVYQQDLQLSSTISTQLVRPQELPMLKADVPVPEVVAGKESNTKTGKDGLKDKEPTTILDAIATGSVAQ